MARRRYVQINGELVEVTPDYIPPVHTNTDAALWNDRHYDGLRATDGTDISSRAKHREYMRVNNLTTADDYTQTWERQAKERQQFFEGKRGSFNKEVIARVIHQLESQRRR